MADTTQNALNPRVFDGERTSAYKFRKNVQNVIAKVKELERVESDVEHEIYMAAKRGIKIGHNIMLLEVNVSRFKYKADNFLKGADKVNSGFLKGRLNVPQRFLLSRKAAQLNADIANVLAERRKHVELEQGAGSDGLESRKILIEHVMAALANDEIYMIGICGMPGVGKTMLADEVKGRVIEEKLFDAAVKVVVSQVPNILDIQGVLAKSLGLDLIETDENGRARRLLSRLTDGSKNLVILDNIWVQVPLDRVGLPFQGEEKGCKVVFTSRNTHMSWLMRAENVEVLPLSNHEARLLFKKIVGNYVEDIANDVADECEGLPLTIKAVACSLINKTREIWKETLDTLRESTATKDFKKEELLTSSIKLSYDLLERTDPEAQSLLLLCCLFPEGADIPRQKLVRYVKGLNWHASSDNLYNTSTRVSILLNAVKNHSLLLRGEKEMSVKMHDVVRDVCLSISSETNKNRFKVEHNPPLMQWPDEEEQRPYTGISLTFDDQMQQLPDGLVYPELKLLQLQFHCDSLDIPADFFNGMKNVRVLDFKRMTLWGKFIKIDALPPTLQFLTNLRTLCIEFCDLSSGDLSLIESHKRLEVLSFFSSKLVNLPLQIQQLTKLKLLDLRCAYGPLIIPSNLLPSLENLEDLYLGNYDSWSRGTEHSVQGQGVNITELSSLSFLKVLQVRVKHPQILLELNEESWFKGLRRFQIAAIQKELSFREYEIGKSITFDRMDWSSFLDAKISLLLSTTECLTLKTTSFKNLFGVCPNLQTLDLYGGDEVRFIMNEGDSPNALNNLKHMEIQSMEDLEAICNGDLPSKSLTNLERVKLDTLPKLTHLWRAPVGSECLGNLRVLEMSYCEAITCMFPFSVAKGLVRLERLDIKCCDMLEWIVSKGEGGVAEKLVLQKLNFISLDDLPSFRSFSPDSDVEEDPFESENTENHKTQGCGLFTRKKRAPVTIKLPANKALPSTINDFKHKDPVLSESTTEPLFNHLVELPSMNKLMVRSMNKLKHIVNDQTSNVFVSKIRIMHVEECESMQAMFDFGTVNAAPMFNKLETVILLKLNNLKHVFPMVPEGTHCFKNLKSLQISSCGSINYIFSVSAAKMLGNLQDLKIQGSKMVEEIIKIDREEKDTIQFAHLRILQLENLDRVTSFSSGNHDFEFPQLQDLLIRECPRMDKFCGGQVTARNLDQVRVGEHQWESIEGGLNTTIQQLNGKRVELASSEIQEV